MIDQYVICVDFNDNIMFNRKKKLAEGEVAPDKRKIRAVKKEQDGITFDSTLEWYMYNLLKENGIRFDMKITYLLQDEFTYRHQKVARMEITPDYILTDYPIIIDTKGFANELSPIRFKMLKHKLHLEGNEKRILMPSNQAKCRHIIQCIKQGYFTVEEPITEHAGTRRKNKLKKDGWYFDNGCWAKDTPIGSVTHVDKFGASHIMKLESYDFEELLLKHR